MKSCYDNTIRVRGKLLFCLAISAHVGMHGLIACEQDTAIEQRPSHDAGLISVYDADLAPDAYAVVPTGPSPFGLPCNGDEDCAAGLLCLRADSDVWSGGGPAHGYCSRDCTGDPELCHALEPSARCLTSAGTSGAFCFKGCTLGDASGAGKCHDRQDVSCALVGFHPVCMPNCGHDGDCPQGRSCNHDEGVCTSAPPAGTTVGSECDLSAPDSCAGYCSSVGNALGVCTGLCVLGVPEACGEAGQNDGGSRSAVCMSFDGNKNGDAGICVQRCGCNEDCDHSDAYCDFQTPQATEGLGVCLFDFDADASGLGVACSQEAGSPIEAGSPADASPGD